MSQFGGVSTSSKQVALTAPKGAGFALCIFAFGLILRESNKKPAILGSSELDRYHESWFPVRVTTHKLNVEGIPHFSWVLVTTRVWVKNTVTPKWVAW